MFKFKKLIKVAMLLALIKPVFANNVDYITKDNFNKIVKENNITQFVYASSWCAMCNTELAKLNKSLPKHTIIVMFPYIIENGKRLDYLKETKEYVENSKFSFKVYYDTNLYLYNLYNIDSVPTKIKINKGEIKK